MKRLRATLPSASNFSLKPNLDNLDQNAKNEYLRLLYSFYGRAQLLGIPYAFFFCFILYGKVDSIWLSVWLLTALLGHALQIYFAKQFFKARNRANFDPEFWHLFAIAGLFLQGFSWSLVIFFIDPELQLEYFLVSFFLILGVLSFSSVGFSNMVLAYTIPIFIAIAVLGYQLFYEFRYLSIISILGIFMFYMISKTFEKTLIESIRMRFENQDLLEALKAKNKEAELANRAKSVFLASASHDLRQPLYGIGLHMDSLSHLLTDDSQRAICDKVVTSVDTLNNLFDGVLDISKLDSQAIEPNFENFRLDHFLSRIVSNINAAATNKGLTLITDCDPISVYSDPILLERIVSNLLSNAIRYTLEGTITISIETTDDQVCLRISDTGVGIANDEHDDIFTEFYQANTHLQPSATGLGLGLSIVKRLCALLAHKLELDSVPGSGSTFSITMPRSQLQTSNSVKPKQPIRNSLRGINILAIDDDQDILQALSKVLHRWGCNVICASSSRQAIEACEQRIPFDLIITDYRLDAKSNGLDLSKQLNQNLNTPTPILFITGDTAPEVLKQINDSGHTLLHKPVGPKVLRDAILSIAF